MAGRSKIFLNHNLARFISTTTANCRKYAYREGKFLKKMMIGETGKRKWYENKQATTNAVSQDKIVSKHITRRTTVLNNIFMEYITDLMATGEMSHIFVGRGLEVTHIKVTNDYRHVLVYWHTKLKECEDTEKILHDYSYKLRHELTQLRVIGQVPLIQFVKNKQISALDDLEQVLQVADYGEDYEPSYPTYVPREPLSLNTKLSPEVREKILEFEKLEKENMEEDESMYEPDLPPMRHDVLGLDHHAIISRVKASLHKSKQAAKNRFNNVNSNIMSFTFDETSTFNPQAIVSSKIDRNAFTEFLMKRREQEKRRMRHEKCQSISTYNMRKEEEYENDDDETDFVENEPDLDVFEDITLESLK